MKQHFLLLLLTLFIWSCDDDDVAEDRLIDPADADAISEVIILPNNAQSQAGNPPPPSQAAAAPEVENFVDRLTSSNGTTSPLNFGYSGITSNLGGCYVQVDGAGEYFTVPYNATSGNDGSLTLPITLPTNVDQGTFCVSFCVYDTEGLVSNVVSTCLDVLRLGTGALQVSLSWDTPTDQDLHVTDPNGETIDYTNTASASGGLLDRDDTNGYGPENIYWLEFAPDGTYTVEVDDYENSSTPNTVYVTVNGPNQSQNYTATTQAGSKVSIVTFTKSGDDISF